MKRILLVCFILLSSLLQAEDIIVTRTSEKIIAIIEEVGSDYIKYHKASDPNGPVFRLETREIATIIYSNGDVQSFEDVATKSPETTQQPMMQQGYFTYNPQNSYGMSNFQFVDYKAIEKHRKDSIKAENKAIAKAKKEERIKNFQEKLNAIPREHFLLANYSFAFDNTHNVGLTYGWCHAVGVYANVMLGLDGFHYNPAGKIEYRGDYQNRYTKWQLTSEHTHQRISFTPGVLVRLGCPLYLTLGCGAVYHSVTYKATNEDWIDCQWLGSGETAITFQVGFIGTFKGVSLMANYANFGVKHSEIMVGIGCAIKGKKGGKK